MYRREFPYAGLRTSQRHVGQRVSPSMTYGIFAQIGRAPGSNLAELEVAKRNQDSKKEPP